MLAGRSARVEESSCADRAQNEKPLCLFDCTPLDIHRELGRYFIVPILCTFKSFMGNLDHFSTIGGLIFGGSIFFGRSACPVSQGQTGAGSKILQLIG